MSPLPSTTARALPAISLAVMLLVAAAPAAGEGWKKHVVREGLPNLTAVAGDFSGDGLPDIMFNAGRRTRLLVAPDWKEVFVNDEVQLDCIHSEVMDVDGDGDLDFIGAPYPGPVFWLERPAKPLSEPWSYHLVDDQVKGIHGLLTGDVDRDGKLDLLATSALPQGQFASSLVWLKVPKNPRTASSWQRHVFADGDAPGLSHYLGMGDVNGDGLPDVASAAKGGPTDVEGKGNWFAWWQAPKDPTGVWTKHLIAGNEPGATNIHPADVNGDGETDFIASRGHGRGVIWFEAPDWRVHDIHATLKEPHSLVATDMDGDGDIDAATCAYGDKQAWWFENDGKGRFRNHLVGRSQEAYDIRAVDIDVDGDLDLLIAGRGSNNVVWFENPRK